MGGLWGGPAVRRGHGRAKGTALVPAHSRYLLCESEFIVSREIINCWADKRHRWAPPGTPSKGAVSDRRDKLRLRRPSPSGLGGKVPRCPFDWGSPRVRLPPGVPRGPLGWHRAGGGLGKGLGGREGRSLPRSARCVRPSEPRPSVHLRAPAWPRWGVPLGAGSASGGRFPPCRQFFFLPRWRGPALSPGSRRSNYRGRARRRAHKSLPPLA